MLKRSEENPIITPDVTVPWQTEATFNGCPAIYKNKIYLLYRATSAKQQQADAMLEVSSIGVASGTDGIHFRNHRQLITPDHDWDRYGCEDPRVTKLDGRYYITYTALSAYPFSAEGIRIGVAVSRDLANIEEKHPVTFFNSKAMTIFPRKINGRYAALLSVHTDRPPARIALAMFERAEQLWSREFWENWYASLDEHILYLRRDPHDHVEVGAPPIWTSAGWLMVYSYIKNYFSPPPTFQIDAVLLHAKNPLRILGRARSPLLVPETEYERYGKVPNIAFPTGVLIRSSKLYVYYGAADTTCCLATAPVKQVLENFSSNLEAKAQLNRYQGNPIIEPRPERPWEAKATFNPAAICLDGKVHLIYRAMSEDNTSVFGYAVSSDGVTINERLDDPVYIPREDFEQKKIPNGNSGCEDPRITKIGNTLYLCYTAFNGASPPRVALTSIKERDFLSRRWNWTKPVLISVPDEDDKDAAIFPRKINGKYAILHRLGLSIWLDFVDHLDFDGSTCIRGKILMSPRPNLWDSRKIGIAAPPIETKDGWLLLYHGVAKTEFDYRVRAALLDLNNPMNVLSRTRDPILAPEMPYELAGQVNNVVFPCGAVVVKNKLFVYYGSADTRIGVATIKLPTLLSQLKAERISS